MATHRTAFNLRIISSISAGRFRPKLPAPWTYHEIYTSVWNILVCTQQLRLWKQHKRLIEDIELQERQELG